MTSTASLLPRHDGTTALLRLEGLVVLAAAAAAYHALGGGWGWFAALFLGPDLSMLGYLAGPRVGAASYNVGHSHLGPALLAVVGLATGTDLALLGALIWVAHIGFDRMLGYGLKRATGFRDTHLGRLGGPALSLRRPRPDKGATVHPGA
jgi:hypothetical protein